MVVGYFEIQSQGFMENKRSLSLVESRHRHFYGGLQSVAQLSPFDWDMAICAVLESGPQFAGSELADHQVVVPLQCFDDFLLCLHVHGNEMKTQPGTEARAKDLPGNCGNCGERVFTNAAP